MFTAVVIGELCEDILMHGPASVEVMGQKTWAKDITITGGGSAFYTGAALAAMGAAVRVCSVLGEDSAGGRLLGLMQSAGIDTSLVKVLPGQTTTASIVVCDGAKKDFVGCSPMLPLYLPRWEEIQGADLLYVAGYSILPEFWSDAFFALCKTARANGVRVAVDSQLLPVKAKDLAGLSRLGEMLAHADIFFAARKDLIGLFGTDDVDACTAQLAKMGFAGQAVLKRGHEGSVVADEEERVFTPAHMVDAYDTVGSGDIYGASYCYARMQNWSTQKSARFAAAYTAQSLGEYKGIKHFSSAEAVENLLTP